MGSRKRCIDEIRKFLETTKGESYDKAASIYVMIMKSESPQTAFEFFMDQGKLINSSEKVECDRAFSANQIREYNKKFSELVSGLLKEMVLRNDDEHTFYSKLWKVVFESDLLFQNEEAKKYALGRLWIDKLIPYFKISDEGCNLSNEEFADIVRRIRPILIKAAYYLNYPFDQKTEFCSRLLELIDHLTDQKEKAVLMAMIINLTERKAVAGVLGNDMQ